jgi:RNA polymerase sigma factor (sigma-70 family)
MAYTLSEHHRPWVGRDEAEDADADLIARVRAGDSEAYGILYERYVGLARARARTSTRCAADADEAVAEAFARTLSALRRGHGPVDNFPAYLSTCVHHACLIRGQRSKTEVVDPVELIRSAEIPEADDFTGSIESGMVLAKAFSSMPTRWQAVLWLTEVEDLSSREVSERFDLSPGALAALSYRARNALSEAYLGAHLTAPTEECCSETVRHLPAYVRETASARRRQRIESHVAGCPACAEELALLQDVNDGLRS